MVRYVGNENGKIKPEVWLKAASALVLAVILVLIYFFNPGFYASFWQALLSDDINVIIEFIAGYGVWAVVISVLLNVMINILGFLPSIFMSTANGVIFGIVPGIIISWLSESIGVTIGFLLLRVLFLKQTEKLMHKNKYLQKFADFSGKNAFEVLLVTRALPYLPSGIVTALGVVSKINLRDYILATLLGKLPAAVFEVMIGYDIVNLNWTRLAFVVTTGAILGCILWQRYKIRHKKKSAR